MAKLNAGNIKIEGEGITIGGDIVGRDKITGGGGEVACDFLWRGATLRALCFTEDQRTIQRLLDRILNNDPSSDKLKQRVNILSPNLWAQIERIEKERGEAKDIFDEMRAEKGAANPD